MNAKDSLIKKLKGYSKKDIIFTTHAKVRAVQRGLDLEEVKDNIANPRRLVYAVKQEARKSGEHKFDCYFLYSKTLCHRYVLIINRRIIICTAIKINRRWQNVVEKYARV